MSFPLPLRFRHPSSLTLHHSCRFSSQFPSFCSFERDPVLFPRPPAPIAPPQQPLFPQTPFPAHPPRPRPQLSASIASLHNAVLVYLYRGLDLHSSRKLPLDAFQCAVVKGFNQILFLETGLEHSLPNHIIAELFQIVLAQPDHVHDAHWNEIKNLVTHTIRFRPRVDLLGLWAWTQLLNNRCHRLLQVWQHTLHQIHAQHPLPPPSHPLIQQGPGPPPPPIGLNPSFFTCLVIVSSLLKDGPSLGQLVKSLTDRVVSRIQYPQADLSKFAEKHRLTYHLRAVELGLQWRQPIQPSSSSASTGHPCSETQVEPPDQDQRIVHLLRRNFKSNLRESIQENLAILDKIQEGVQGSHPHSDGWLRVDWTEPDLSIHEKNISERIAKRDIVLTQRVIAVLLNGFAQLARWDIVERLVDFSRSLGGMSRYLWTNLLRGAITRPQMLLKLVHQMRAEDQVEPDLQIQCILIAATISRDINKGLSQIQDLISNHQRAPSSSQQVDFPTENFNTIVSTLLRHDLVLPSKEMLSTLSIQPNTTTLNHFLNFYSRQASANSSSQPHRDRLLEEVLKDLQMFESRGVKPDVISFTILLNIMINCGLQTKGVVSKVLGLMESMNVQANAITYGSIINQLCKTGGAQDVFLAYDLLNEIESRRVATTAITYTALIQALLGTHVQEFTGQGDKNSGNSGSAPDQKKKDSLVCAVELIDRMKSRQQPINQVIYNSLLNTFLTTSKIPEALQVLDLLRKQYLLLPPDQRRPQMTDASTAQARGENEGVSGGGMYYGDGLVDSYGIVFRRLIELGELDRLRMVYNDFLELRFKFVPGWVQRYLGVIRQSLS